MVQKTFINSSMKITTRQPIFKTDNLCKEMYRFSSGTRDNINQSEFLLESEILVDKQHDTEPMRKSSQIRQSTQRREAETEPQPSDQVKQIDMSSQNSTDQSNLTASKEKTKVTQSQVTFSHEHQYFENLEVMVETHASEKAKVAFKKYSSLINFGSPPSYYD